MNIARGLTTLAALAAVCGYVLGMVALTDRGHGDIAAWIGLATIAAFAFIGGAVA